MSNYNTYNTQVENRIANTSEIFYDEEMKREAMDNTIEEILRLYDVREFRRKTTITFDSDGEASKPADYFRMKKLWNVDSNGVETAEYHFKEPEEMDGQSTSASYYWTEDDDGTGTMILKCWPTDSGELQIRYIARPTELTDTTTDCGLSSDWDEAVVFGTVFRLYQNAGRYDEAMNFKQFYDDALAKCWQATKNIGGIKQNNRIRSKWDRMSLLGGFTIGGYDKTT